MMLSLEQLMEDELVHSCYLELSKEVCAFSDINSFVLNISTLNSYSHLYLLSL